MTVTPDGIVLAGGMNEHYQASGVRYQKIASGTSRNATSMLKTWDIITRRRVTTIQTQNRDKRNIFQNRFDVLVNFTSSCCIHMLLVVDKKYILPKRHIVEATQK